MWKRPDARVAGHLVPMTPPQVDAVMAVELAVYPFPWTRGNFIDSIAAGHAARVLLDERGELLGYFVAMAGFEEMHLLNITVAPNAQRRGHASEMFDALRRLCQAHGARQLWLEVRGSNADALAVYRHLGFARIGLRKGYYPAPAGRREDAIVMSLKVDSAPASVKGGDALE